ncbi:MAG: hypothetical protein H6705_20720 [Myxococcales bacterium]|nr:hypothetical protein [Myxococcales bacterium]
MADAWTFASGATGKVARQEFDLDFDGKVDVWRFFDAQGQVEREQMDMDADGKVDVTGFFAAGR